MGTWDHSSYFCLQIIIFSCGFHHPVDSVPESLAVWMCTSAAWEAIFRGGKGRQPEMKYFLQQYEQGCLEGGGVLCVSGKRSRGEGGSYSLKPLLLCARNSTNYMYFLIYCPKNCYKLSAIIIPITYYSNKGKKSDNYRKGFCNYTKERGQRGSATHHGIEWSSSSTSMCLPVHHSALACCFVKATSEEIPLDPT